MSHPSPFDPAPTPEREPADSAASSPTASAGEVAPPEEQGSEQPESRFLLEGLAHLEVGDLVEAIGTYGAGLAQYPNSLSLRENRARAWMLAGHHRRALTDLDFALEMALGALEDPQTALVVPSASGMDPKQALEQRYRDLRCLATRLELARGVCWVYTGSEEAADNVFSRLLGTTKSESGPSGSANLLDAHLEAEARCAWAAVLTSREALPEAYREAAAAARLLPEDPKYRRLVERLKDRMTVQARNAQIETLEQEISEHLASARAEEALRLLRELRDLTGETAQLLQWFGAAYHQLGRYEEELEALDRSFELDGNEVALFNRAVCYLKQERKEEARRDFRAVAELSRERSTVAYAKAMVTLLTQPSKN